MGIIVVADIDPLYTEREAAHMIGIKPRTLRTERYAGRIRYRQVASRVMYRLDDLKAWQEGICRGGDQTKDRSSFSLKRGAGDKVSGTSDGPRAAEVGSVQQAQAIAETLIRSSAGGSSNAAGQSKSRRGAGHVIPLRPE